MKKILKIISPSVLMLALIFLMRDGKDILNGLYFIFPIMYIVMGIIASDFKKELVISLLTTSFAFLVPINLGFNMGPCIDLILIYNSLGMVTYLIKYLIKRRKKKTE